MGEAFVSLSQEAADVDDENTEALLQQAGGALIEAGMQWTQDWGDVTIAMEDAANAFSKLSDDPHNTQELSDLYSRIADELYDASTIEGCLSIGPPSSVPNLEAIRDILNDFDDGNSDYNECIQQAANAIDALITELEGWRTNLQPWRLNF